MFSFTYAFKGEIYSKLKNMYLEKPPLISKKCFFDLFALVYTCLLLSTLYQDVFYENHFFTINVEVIRQKRFLSVHLSLLMFTSSDSSVYEFWLVLMKSDNCSTFKPKYLKVCCCVVTCLHLSTFIYNPGHNILELYSILVKIQFTTSKTKLDI